MARQKGIIKIKGKIGDISFYKTQDGHLAREKGGVDGDRIKNDPAFVRTRENGAEFGSSASSGKLLRDALRPLLLNASDNRMVSRVTKVMTDIKNIDTTSARGKRTVATGLVQQQGKDLLRGFNFNNRAILGAILFKPYVLDPVTGEITISNLVPMTDIAYPSGATHVQFKSAWLQIDFAANAYDVQYSVATTVAIDAAMATPVLTPASAAAVPTGNGVDVFLLIVEFFQEINAVRYPLRNGAYNALSIVDVR